jgi:8-oxo-dGTP pyrophosphatase MutT (NUDIX family)
MKFEKKILTLCVVYNNTHILLGMKKRGFGEGKWNGFGGKVEEGESIEEAARRELVEEVSISPVTIEKRGILSFRYPKSNRELEVHYFGIPQFIGEPIESDEMRPQWFRHADIPFDAMWPDDKHWMPLFLAGKNIAGECYFTEDNKIIKHDIKEL